MDARETEGWNLHADELSLRSPLVVRDGIIVTYPYNEAEKFIGDNEGADWALSVINRLDLTRVLDVGCGVGLYSGLFDGLDYTGVDQNPEMICRAKQNHPDKNYQTINGRELGSLFDDSCFDLVYTRAVIQHNRGQDKKELVDQIRRVIKPDGFLLCMESELLTDGRDSLSVAEEFADLFGFELIDHHGPFGRLFTKRNSV